MFSLCFRIGIPHRYMHHCVRPKNTPFSPVLLINSLSIFHVSLFPAPKTREKNPASLLLFSVIRGPTNSSSRSQRQKIFRLVFENASLSAVTWFCNINKW
ncbi:hypothetical protein RvY_03963-3 [Ramazzottius varieornatus]|uniref:Uncharacterized protein n=1 Tax=Ramazzottius varieornatus TaxID=947166 RepID=A0A1D1UPW8_RAMVA|nr:hypothetical protein RvY_03963-3 [Ramazzottius varieornatus]